MNKYKNDNTVCVGKKKKCLCCVAFSKGSRPTKITKIVGKAQK